MAILCHPYQISPAAVLCLLAVHNRYIPLHVYTRVIIYSTASVFVAAEAGTDTRQRTDAQAYANYMTNLRVYVGFT